jgi:hypothetical protein
MASAQEPGLIQMFIEKPSGTRYLVFKMRSEEAGPGGAPDHVVSANTDKWRFIQRQGGQIERGDKLIILFTSDSADSLDTSDCVYSIPITNLANGIVDRITDNDLTLKTDPAVAEATETRIGEYEFTSGGKQFGGGYIGVFIEDDT